MFEQNLETFYQAMYFSSNIPDSSIRNKLIKTKFKLKNSPYSISIDRTVGGCFTKSVKRENQNAK